LILNIPQPITDWGSLSRQRAKWKKPSHHFWKAVKINPKSTDAYTNLGNALAIQGKAEEALAAFRNAIAISPTFDAYNNLGILLQSLGRTREAEESFRKAAELKKDK